MSGVDDWNAEEFEEPAAHRLEPHQVKAAAAPHVPIRALAGEQPAGLGPGNFQDLESLLEQLGAPPIFELGKPEPSDRYMPRPRAGSCPAAHNEALLDDED